MHSRPEASRTEDGEAPWPVMVLAHNEERRIAACLDSIYASGDGRKLEIFVMANGCTDRTADIVEEYARTRAGLHVVPIALGDKCNAWNVFIHDTVPAQCPGREIYFFVNGDVRVVPGSFAAMARALLDHPGAHAASAIPAAGRSAAADSRTILEERGLAANLYALRGFFVGRLRRMSVRLPLNLEGDDGLLGALIKWDLAPGPGGMDDGRITPCRDATFVFDSLSPFRPADWTLYWRRLMRYARRSYEFELLGARLRQRGLSGLPADIVEVYPEAMSLRPRWQGIHTVCNLMALRQMQRLGSARGNRNRAASPPLEPR